jgi:hypothetical protein
MGALGECGSIERDMYLLPGFACAEYRLKHTWHLCIYHGFAFDCGTECCMYHDHLKFSVQ